MIDTKSSPKRESARRSKGTEEEKQSVVDKEYIRQVVSQGLSALKQVQEQSHVLFGTDCGSIGSLIEIPEKTYTLLNLLEKAMDKTLELN